MVGWERYSFADLLEGERCLRAYNDVNNQEDATTFSFFILFKSAQHVSGDKFAHLQEHFLTVYTAFGTMHRHCGSSVGALYQKLCTGCPRRNGPDFGRVFLRSNYTDITQPISKVQWLRKYWPEKFETLTAITHLLITKYILKLAGICGFCNVNICT